MVNAATSEGGLEDVPLKSAALLRQVAADLGQAVGPLQLRRRPVDLSRLTYCWALRIDDSGPPCWGSRQRCSRKGSCNL